MLLTIADDLQLEIASFLTSPSDCAALCLAVPRGLGLAALRRPSMPHYKDVLVSVALRLATGELQIDEALLRRYLWDWRVTPDGCDWLTAAAQRAGLSMGIVRMTLPGGFVRFFFGARNAERKVRLEFSADAENYVILYDGKKGEERMVRMKLPRGTVVFFEGEKGVERMVRQKKPDGLIVFYEGEKGAERMWTSWAPRYDTRGFWS